LPDRQARAESANRLAGRPDLVTVSNLRFGEAIADDVVGTTVLPGFAAGG
jgi:hypothetical protein